MRGVDFIRLCVFLSLAVVSSSPAQTAREPDLDGLQTTPGVYSRFSTNELKEILRWARETGVSEPRKVETWDHDTRSFLLSVIGTEEISGRRVKSFTFRTSGELDDGKSKIANR